MSDAVGKIIGTVSAAFLPATAAGVVLTTMASTPSHTLQGLRQSFLLVGGKIRQGYSHRVAAGCHMPDA
jgi:hypothetical protein